MNAAMAKFLKLIVKTMKGFADASPREFHLIMFNKGSL